LMVVVTAFGWALGVAIRSVAPFDGSAKLIAECALWVVFIVLAASPLANRKLRSRLAGLIPS